MKLLDWMHRKFRNGEPPKEFATGNHWTCLLGQPSLDDLEFYPKSNYYAKPSSKPLETQHRKSFACLEAVRADGENMEEASSAALSELFHGFLAIGTLGTDPVTSDPATPTFSTSVEYIMEKETEATENELQLINDELEKVLGAEGKEDDSSGRKISRGHNLLVLARDLGHYLQIGTTIDDAIGEAYDKTAKWLGLDLRKSGGAAIEELARRGDAESIKFSVPMKQHKDCNFSYAGLKTQVRLAIESKNIDAGIPLSSASIEEQGLRADIAASFQRVAVLHLEERCERAIQWALEIEPSIKHLVVSGGVASNQYVRARLQEVVARNSLQLVCPPPSLCTDNGVMIAWTGIENFRLGRFDPPPPAVEPEDCQLDLRPRWPLGEEYGRGRSVARSMRTARIHPSLTSLTQASQHQHP